MPQPTTPQQTNWKQLRRLAAIVLVCGFVGEYFLHDAVRTIGDPSGKGISFGLGGMFGLLLGFIIHLWTRKSRQTS
ncbi:hypothetical protein [Rubinisphaera brasiliensis]|uniref:Uncharacterized protein n=1 Tax=Rubinisphaera brasiliensis (strain ATCC 49424 / DSM 5305 / JCM 21570 / IAM 15109 / NBRC 103401 / IFAM 1448) TaxID=756272 RepID=F0SPJ5_RUBBR|nr:hypothetical protein [Rubinisphaera brasiliensis]ADY57899.1 hypothetical protein Plabr_0270 [Rubinisphaera brasiliensis DSM 5305]